jgi:hypothetical protein
VAIWMMGLLAATAALHGGRALLHTSRSAVTRTSVMVRIHPLTHRRKFCAPLHGAQQTT